MMAAIRVRIEPTLFMRIRVIKDAFVEEQSEVMVSSSCAIISVNIGRHTRALRVITTP